MSERIYCIDTSSILDLIKHHPTDIFETLWTNLDKLMADGRLVVHERVQNELQGKDDDAKAWVKTVPRSAIARLDADQGAFITRLGREYRHMAWRISQPEYEKKADVFLVGLAVSRGYVVVTEEADRQWHIPDLCKRYDVESINRWGLIRGEGWKF